MTNHLTEKRCLPCEGGVEKLTPEQVKALLNELPGWETEKTFTRISREFRFRNYFQTMAFVNAIAWMAHQENHHPDLEVHYNFCVVHYNTHAIGGLSENDFICAAKVNALVPEEGMVSLV